MKKNGSIDFSNQEAINFGVLVETDLLANMASYLTRTQNGITYICYAESFRNENGKPDNKKVIIGKIDNVTN
jgi:hypothetical protein